MKKKNLLLTAFAALGLTVATMAQSVTYCNASFSLDGIDDFGSIPNVFFQNVNQRDFTIEFYLKADASQTQYPGIWGKSGYWSEINVAMYIPGKVQYGYCTSFNGNQCFSSDTVSWTADVWNHYAVVGDGNNNQLRIYKNGILDASSPHGTPNWSLPNNDSKLGAVYQGWVAPNIQYLKGKIDDFRVSNIARYSLNFTPPQNLSNDNNTRVLYNFNSVLAGVVPDLSGNNNHLTLQNGAVLDVNDVPYGSIGDLYAGTNQTVCDGANVTLSATGAFLYTWNNGVSNAQPFTPTTSQDYIVTGVSSSGCIGNDTVSVVVLEPTFSTQYETACNSFTWINGITYSTSNNTATYTLINSIGCDSVVTLNLTINNSSVGSQIETALDSYTWPLNNQTYSQSGTYTDTIPNTVGCDSIVTLNLTMNFSGINELNQSKLIISPNPTKDNFSIMGLDKLGNVSSMVLKDLNGKIVKVLNPKATQFKITDLKSGVYFLTISAGEMQEVIKLIKE
jgi:hypothetical protein